MKYCICSSVKYLLSFCSQHFPIIIIIIWLIRHPFTYIGLFSHIRIHIYSHAVYCIVYVQYSTTSRGDPYHVTSLVSITCKESRLYLLNNYCKYGLKIVCIILFKKTSLKRKKRKILSWKYTLLNCIANFLQYNIQAAEGAYTKVMDKLRFRKNKK